MDSLQFLYYATEALSRIREKSPLVLNLTNSVVQPISANLLLAIGATPAMLNDASEAEDMLKTCANALLINVGTLTAEQAVTMKAAIRVASIHNIPWVLDPVAYGTLSLRTNFVTELLQTMPPPTIIRGNATEILALDGAKIKPRGAESTCQSEEAYDAAQSVALKCNSIVIVSGATDFITDGKTIVGFKNGHPLMKQVTGVGCAMGSLTAACAAVCDTPFEAAIASSIILGISGEIAAKNSKGPGSFAINLLDTIARLTEEDIQKHIIISEENNNEIEHKD